MRNDLDELAFRFFKLFAQYEYALKATGYGIAGRQGQAEPDWDRFSNGIGAAILSLQDEQLAEARQYILEHPPKRQIWVNNSVEWREVLNKERSPQILFVPIRRVRNNLYHGGKFNGRWTDPDQSRQLISKALLILETLASRTPELLLAIQGNHA